MIHSDDYDKIMLSLKEKFILYQILKRKEVDYTFCTDRQKEVFLNYGLIVIRQQHTVSSTGLVVPVAGAPKYIQTTDKAFRYFLYRKESYFKGKFPVVIAFIALAKSFDAEICLLVSFISDWISRI